MKQSICPLSPLALPGPRRPLLPFHIAIALPPLFRSICLFENNILNKPRLWSDLFLLLTTNFQQLTIPI